MGHPAGLKFFGNSKKLIVADSNIGLISIENGTSEFLCLETDEGEKKFLPKKNSKSCFIFQKKAFQHMQQIMLKFQKLEKSISVFPPNILLKNRSWIFLRLYLLVAWLNSIPQQENALQ